MPASALHEPLLRWYAANARTLPWREDTVTGWHILVSEVMLQQTPVARVLPVYDAWIDRWPAPAALAKDSPGEAVRCWGRLGYPRRALRLHAAAVLIDAQHAGVVPTTYPELRALPGVGDYTAAAVAAFGSLRREVVLDTNVRRVLGRVFTGAEFPPATVHAAERRLASSVLPDDGPTAAAWSVAVMELGALVCSARAPQCSSCPLRADCAWRRRGYPTSSGPRKRQQPYAGTQRECRGRILAVLRDSDLPVSRVAVDTVWPDPAQRERALGSLLEDGLVTRVGEDELALPR